MTIHSGVVAGTIEYSSISYVPDWIGEVVTGTDPSVWEASFVVKTTHASTQPIVEANPVHHNAQRALSFVDDFYNRIIIDPTIIDVGNLVSDQFYEIQVFNGYFSEKTLTSYSVQNADGMVVSGPVTPALWGALETRTYAITISTEGPASINAQLLFDFEGTSDDIIIQISGSRIVMLPYQAEVPWSESLEWKTNVLTTNNGTEQRIRLRKKARQSVKALYPIPNQHLAKAFNMAYGWVQRAWAVALWSETQYVGNLTAGATSIACNTEKYDIRANSMVSIWQSNDHNDVIEVESVLPGSVQLKRVLAKSYNNALIMPVRIGNIKGGIQRTTDGYKSSLGMEYDFKDNIDLSPVAPSQYLNYDIYYDETIKPSESIEEKITSRIDIIDYDTGVANYIAPWLYNRKLRTVQFVNEGAEESWAFRQWLHRRAGRLKAYWLPSFEHNLRLKMQGNVSASLICYSDDYRNLGDDHNNIAIQYTDGTWRARAIVGHSYDDDDTIQVAIDSPLNVDATLIKQISFLSLHRLNSDRVNIDWIGNNVSVSTIQIIEIKP